MAESLRKAFKTCLIMTVITLVVFFISTGVIKCSDNQSNTNQNSTQTDTRFDQLGIYKEDNTGQNNAAAVSNTETESESTEYSTSSDTQTIVVKEVIDGDTFKYDDFVGVSQRVRLIGIDTPESVNVNHPELNCKYGKVASKYTKSVLEGKTVKIEYDTDKYDIYDRELAYVYIDDVMLNYDLVAKGYAVAKEYPPNTKYSEMFKKAQIEAEKNKLGMWSDDVSVKDCNLKEEYYIEY